MIAYFAQEGLFRLLMAVPGFVVLLVWISICLAQLKLRKKYPSKPTFKLWGYPYITIFGICCLSVIALFFLLDAQNQISIGICLVVFVVLTIWSKFRFKPKTK
ncbi:gamma-aminobutyrate transporter [compost metagenome]